MKRIKINTRKVGEGRLFHTLRAYISLSKTLKIILKGIWESIK